MLQKGFASELERALGREHVVSDPAQLKVYDCDGLTGWRALPALVVLPGSTEDVQAVVRACHREGVPFVARGAGTGLSGGALPVADGVAIPSVPSEPTNTPSRSGPGDSEDFPPSSTSSPSGRTTLSPVT